MLEDIIKKIDYFPPFPAGVQKALNVIHSPGAGTDDILAAIQYDVAITTNLLRLCNSPVFAFRREISSVREALVYVGVEELKKLIMFLASAKIFKVESRGYETRKGEMVRYSIASAVLSNGLLPFAPPLPCDLFTTSLVLDVGKVVLNEFVGRSYEEIHGLVERGDMDFTAAEEKVLGISHPEVGARILAKWGFPAPMVEAVRYHHTPDCVPDSPLTHFASLAGTMAMFSGLSTGVDGMAYKGFPDLCRRYKIKHAHITEILADSLEHIQNVVYQLGYGGD